MLDWLRAIDHSLFFFINGQFTSPFLDWFMPFITREWTWAPFIAAAWIGLLISRRPGHRQLALAMLLTCGLTDTLGSHVLKPMVGRERPCIAMADKVMLRVNRSGSPSFPSNHAANTASVAATVGFMGGGCVATMALSLLAFVIGWSRIYVGVHFPIDVTCGALIGVTMAFTVSRVLIALHWDWWNRRPLVSAAVMPPVASVSIAEKAVAAANDDSVGDGR